MSATASGPPGTAGLTRGLALIADPVYQSIPYTVSGPDDPGEVTEETIIDTPWMQRLRRIHQLQSARWVYPGAEHSRFQHSLGTMHMAGRFARHLYPSLQAACADLPSAACVEETCRLAGLLHDIGHGPYGHFFDDNFLDRFNLTHELLGHDIICRKLGQLLSRIRRSPSGPLAAHETIDPAQVGFLIMKPPDRGVRDMPRWLQLLQQLFSGIYTVDNLDYVQRDAYMTGFATAPVDVDRLLFYSFFTPQGLTLHQAGVSAFTRFLNARLHLYSNVYFHRVGRAIDFHMQEIFAPTMARVFPWNPRRCLGRYLQLTEWSLMQEVEAWARSADPLERRLGREWDRIINRRIKWKMAYATELTIDRVQKGLPPFGDPAQMEAALRQLLPRRMQRVEFKIDLATMDPRPLNPMAQSNKRVLVHNGSTGMTSAEPLREIFKYIPARVVHLRVFTRDRRHDAALAHAAEQLFNGALLSDAASTNL